MSSKFRDINLKPQHFILYSDQINAAFTRKNKGASTGSSQRCHRRTIFSSTKNYSVKGSLMNVSFLPFYNLKNLLSAQTLEHKTSFKCTCFSRLRFIHHLKAELSFIDVWFVMIRQYLKIWNLRVQKKSKY